MPAKVSKGKHRGKKQKQEEGEEESAVIEYEVQPGNNSVFYRGSIVKRY